MLSGTLCGTWPVLLGDRADHGQTLLLGFTLSDMWSFHDPTKHANMSGNNHQNLDTDKRIYHRAKKLCCSLISYVVLLYCDILLGNMMKLRVFVCQLGDQIAPKATHKPYRTCFIFEKLIFWQPARHQFL